MTSRRGSVVGPRRGRRLLVAIGTGCAATTLGLLPAAAATQSPTPVPSPGVTATDPAAPDPAAPDPGGPPKVVDRKVKDDRVTEASGLVTSRTLNGVLWTFNDSGGTPDLFGIGRDGSVTARIRVTGAVDTDWESAAGVRLLSGAPAVAIGDTGDNRGDRPSITIYVVAEPRSAGTTKERPVRTVTLTYPDRPTDAEALVADPRTNRLYVVTKGLLGGRLYAVPEQVWPGGRKTGAAVSGTLEYLARVPLVLVTDGVGMPDGRVALRTYGELAIMPPVPTGGEEVWSPLATTPLPHQGQGEGLALTRARDAFLLGTEGANKPILRFVPPADVMAAQPAAAATPTATVTPGAGGTTGSGPGGGAGRTDRGTIRDTLFLAGGAGLVGALAVAAAVSGARRRR